MSLSNKILLIILVTGIIALFLPDRQVTSTHLKPDKLVRMITREDHNISVDEVARLLNNEDSTIQIIDLRSPDEYRYSYIPGAINIPFESFLDEEYRGYIDQTEFMNILYSNGDIISSQAWMYASQMGYGSIKVMKGGMNEWYRTVMLSEFSGNRISPRENALYENRYRARKFFIQMNSLPDSLKTTFLAARKAKEMELVGGCE